MAFPSYGTVLPFQDFEQATLQASDGGDVFPTSYFAGGGPGGAEGGDFVASLDTTNKVKGTKSCRMRITAGTGAWGLYAQFNPYNGGRKFARDYAVGVRLYAQSWVMKTYTHFRLWIKIAGNLEPSIYKAENYYFGMYVKHVTNPDFGADGTGGGHPYMAFQAVPGLWTQVVLCAHPDNWAGIGGQTPCDYDLYPTAHQVSLGDGGYGGTFDPPNTYNFWDCTTRVYVSHVMDDSAVLATTTTDYWLDQMEFWSNPHNAVEANQTIFGVSAAHDPATGRIYVGWSFHKAYFGIFNIRYAFSNIHTLGYTNATVPPGGGVVAPLGDVGWNTTWYDTTALAGALVGQTALFVAIKPTSGPDAGTFTQVEIPLVIPYDAAADTLFPAAPTGLGLSAISATQINLSWTAVTTNTDTTAITDLNHYNIYRGPSGGPTTLLAQPFGLGTTFSSTGLTGSTVYRYQVTAVDNTGNESGKSTFAEISTLAPDTTAPSVPTWGTATPASATQIDLSWNASTDDVDVSAALVYRVFRDTVEVGTTAPGVTTYHDTGLNPSTPYSYTLRARDTSLNSSNLSSALGATTPSLPAIPVPLLRYRLNNNALDTGTAGLNGTVTGATFTTDAQLGSHSLSFASGNFVRVSRATSIEPAEMLTLMCWVKPNGTQVSYANIIRKTYQNNATFPFASYGLRLNAGGEGTTIVSGVIGFPSDNRSISSAFNAVPAGVWTHVALTYDRTAAAPQQRLYVNGVEVNQATLATTILYDTTATGDFYMGQNGAGGEFYVGQLDDVRLYGVALSAAAIQAVMIDVIDLLAPAAPENLRIVSL